MDDIIDFRLLLRKLAAYWKSALLVGFLVTVLAVVGLYKLTPNLRISVEIFEAPASVNDQYLILNNAMERIAVNESSNVENPANILLKINRRALMIRFTDPLARRNGIAEALISSGIAQKKPNEAQASFDYRVRQMAYRVNVQPPSSGPKQAPESRGRWKLAFATKNTGSVDEFVQAIYSTNTEAARTFFINSIEARINYIEEVNKVSLTQLQLQRANAIAQYKQKLQANLSFLKEQAIIARSLNISKNTLETQKITENTSIIAADETKQPYYLRGYEAIEKDIELQSSRQNDEDFIPELVAIDQGIRSIKQDTRPHNIRAALEASPLKKPDFTAIYTGLNSIVVRRQIPITALLFLSLILGGIVSALWVLLRPAPKLDDET